MRFECCYLCRVVGDGEESVEPADIQLFPGRDDCANIVRIQYPMDRLHPFETTVFLSENKNSFNKKLFLSLVSVQINQPFGNYDTFFVVWFLFLRLNIPLQATCNSPRREVGRSLRLLCSLHLVSFLTAPTQMVLRRAPQMNHILLHLVLGKQTTKLRQTGRPKARPCTCSKQPANRAKGARETFL